MCYAFVISKKNLYQRTRYQNSLVHQMQRISLVPNYVDLSYRPTV